MAGRGQPDLISFPQCARCLKVSGPSNPFLQVGPGTPAPSDPLLLSLLQNPTAIGKFGDVSPASPVKPIILMIYLELIQDSGSFRSCPCFVPSKWAVLCSTETMRKQASKGYGHKARRKALGQYSEQQSDPLDELTLGPFHSPLLVSSTSRCWVNICSMSDYCS